MAAVFEAEQKFHFFPKLEISVGLNKIGFPTVIGAGVFGKGCRGYRGGIIFKNPFRSVVSIIQGEAQVFFVQNETAAAQQVVAAGGVIFVVNKCPGINVRLVGIVIDEAFDQQILGEAILELGTEVVFHKTIVVISALIFFIKS